MKTQDDVTTSSFWSFPRRSCARLSEHYAPSRTKRMSGMNSKSRSGWRLITSFTEFSSKQSYYFPDTLKNKGS
jgi:hypothetical protein